MGAAAGEAGVVRPGLEPSPPSMVRRGSPAEAEVASEDAGAAGPPGAAGDGAEAGEGSAAGTGSRGTRGAEAGGAGRDEDLVTAVIA